MLALAALQSGEPEAAETRLRSVFDHVVAVGLLEPGTFPVAPDLVEALALQGRHDEALEVTRWLEQISADQDHPWGHAMSERSRVLVGLLDGSIPSQEASSRITAVADALTTLGLLHDAARAHLVIGSALRRQRQWGLARDHLDGAQARFEELGAGGWSATVSAELESGRGPPPGRRRRADTYGAGGRPACCRRPGQQDDRPTSERGDRHRRDAPDAGVRQARGALAGPARHPPAGAVCRPAASLGRVSQSMAAPAPPNTHAGGVTSARKTPSLPAHWRRAIARPGRRWHPPAIGRHAL